METNETQQETSTTSEATPIETTTDTTSTAKEATDTTTTQSTQEAPENWEYNGDRKTIPKQFANYAKGFDRAWSKKSQTLTELSQKAREYEEFKTSQEFQTFQKLKAEGKIPTGNQEQSVITQDELDAISLGDAKTLESVIERKARQMLETTVNPQLAEFKKEKEQMAIKQRESAATEHIDSFSKQNPDFKELLESPVGEFMIDAARRGLPIDQIYETAKEAETFFAQRSEVKRKADLQKKKDGTVVGKSIPGTPDIVYADDENSAKRLAIELTLKGDKRHVRIKPKK